MRHLTRYRFSLVCLGLILVASTVTSAFFTASVATRGNAEAMASAPVSSTAMNEICAQCAPQVQNVVQGEDGCGGCLSSDMLSGTCGAMCTLMAGSAVLPTATLTGARAVTLRYGNLDITAKGRSLLLDPAPPKQS